MSVVVIVKFLCSVITCPSIYCIQWRTRDFGAIDIEMGYGIFRKENQKIYKDHTQWHVWAPLLQGHLVYHFPVGLEWVGWNVGSCQGGHQCGDRKFCRLVPSLIGSRGGDILRTQLFNKKCIFNITGIALVNAPTERAWGLDYWIFFHTTTRS